MIKQEPMIDIKCEPSDNYDTVNITCEPSNNYDTVDIKYEPSDNYDIIDNKCEPSDFYETVNIKCEKEDLQYQSYDCSMDSSYKKQENSLDFNVENGTHLLSDLDSCRTIKRQGWADSTSGTYRTHLKTYVKFWEDYKLKPVPCDQQQTVELYIAYLFDKKHFAYSSIRCYINIISVLHKMHDLKDLVADFWNIKHLLTGVKRELGASQSCKAPVTPELLLNVRKSLDKSNHNNVVFWASCLTGFFVFLRPNNFLVKGTFNPEINLRRIDVLSCSWGILLRLKVIKTLQFCSKPIEVVLPYLHDHPLCPATAMSNVLALAGDPLDPLFRLLDRSCLTCIVFLNNFRFILQHMKMDQLRYRGHSFRRGAATWGSKVGLSDSAIKLLGYWSSDCFSRYVDTDIEERLKAISTFSSLLPR
ncbi:uncharacterized protein LOC127718859 [Mytilus californianus]|uniref:uncharacterized protein LOC127718859 n=1 Tax=Mytilus californianus TaxID=6549 RepID=UPI002247109F|nr:uncharacterized protein LOC127718859 [Mytilus californianus]